MTKSILKLEDLSQTIWASGPVKLWETKRTKVAKGAKGAAHGFARVC